jgi:hypothetical protein
MHTTWNATFDNHRVLTVLLGVLLAAILAIGALALVSELTTSSTRPAAPPAAETIRPSELGNDPLTVRFGTLTGAAVETHPDLVSDPLVIRYGG